VAFNGIKIKQSFIKITEFIQVKLKEHTQTHSYLICTQMFKVHSLSLNIFKQLFLLHIGEQETHFVFDVEKYGSVFCLNVI